MSYANRCRFALDWESQDRDYYMDKAHATVWRHRLLCGGSITVQHRLTGFGYDVWDEETGYSSPCGQFWLASGGWDIRDHLSEFDSEEAMIQWVIDRANNCTGGHRAGERVGASLEWLTARENWRPKAAEATP